MVSTHETTSGVTGKDDSVQLETLSRRFNRKVALARTVLFAERLWPRVIPSLCTGGLFLTTSWLGLWHALPPQGRMGGLALFAAVTVISPLLVKTKSLIVTRRDAIDRIDAALGDPSRPALMMDDDIPAESSPANRQLWNSHKLQMMEQWVDKIRIALPHSDVRQRDRYFSRYLIAASVAASAIFAGDQRLPRIMEAFNWTAPVLPVTAKAWVNPPEGFKDQTLVFTQDSPETAQDGQKYDAHKGSTMTIVVFDRNAPVSLNGTPVSLAREVIPKEGSQDRPTYHYEFSLQQGPVTIAVGPSLRWQIAVGSDDAPTATIGKIAPSPKETGSLDIEFNQKDDFGINESIIRIVPSQKKDGDATPLPSSNIPKIDLR